MHDQQPTTGQTITTFTFLLFGLLLGLAALAEPVVAKAAAIGFCAVLSLLGAARFRIQAMFAARNLHQKQRTERTRE